MGNIQGNRLNGRARPIAVGSGKGDRNPLLLPSPGRSIEMQKVLHISQQKDRQADRELDKRQKL